MWPLPYWAVRSRPGEARHKILRYQWVRVNANPEAIVLKRVAEALHASLVLLVTVNASLAQAGKPEPRDTAAVQKCLDAAKNKPQNTELCVGVLANPCLEGDSARSTADMVKCSAREHAVWDVILNRTYAQLREQLDKRQQIKLRDMQRAWIASREKTCAFYWDFHQGTMAVPMAAYCDLRETARRAIFLMQFLPDNVQR
jgi:uncharacterized protein YecT (DUF1311 family)